METGKKTKLDELHEKFMNLINEMDISPEDGYSILLLATKKGEDVKEIEENKENADTHVISHMSGKPLDISQGLTSLFQNTHEGKTVRIGIALMETVNKSQQHG